MTLPCCWQAEKTSGKKTTHGLGTYGKKATCVLHSTNRRSWRIYAFYELNWKHWYVRLRETGSLPTAVGQPGCVTHTACTSVLPPVRTNSQPAAGPAAQGSPSTEQQQQNRNPTFPGSLFHCQTVFGLKCCISWAENNRPGWQELTGVTHQLENSREGPGLQPPPPPPPLRIFKR